MNAARRIHTVSASRSSRSTNATTGVETVTQASALTGVRCRVRPLGSKQAESLLGRNVQGVYAIEWGSEDMRDGDLLTFASKVYELKETRPLTLPGALIKTQTGVLVEVTRKQV